MEPDEVTEQPTAANEATSSNYSVNTYLTDAEMRLLNSLLFPKTGKISADELATRKSLWKRLILPAEQESGVSFE